MILPVIHVSKFRTGQEIVKRMRHESDINILIALKARGYSNVTIAKLMGISESSVRLLNSDSERT